MNVEFIKNELLERLHCERKTNLKPFLIQCTKLNI